jgi:hypothetical protein
VDLDLSVEISVHLPEPVHLNGVAMLLLWLGPGFHRAALLVLRVVHPCLLLVVPSPSAEAIVPLVRPATCSLEPVVEVLLD